MATSPTSVADAIEGYIRSEFQVAPDDPLFTRDAHLFDLGFVDSIGFAQIIAFLESTFGITIEEEHLFGEQLATINGMAEVVLSCLSETADRLAGRG